MELVQSTSLFPSRRDFAARIFRKRTVFGICFAFILLGFFLTGQFKPKYRADMKILIRKERVDPIVTTNQSSTPELQTLNVREEDLNSQVELLKGEDLLRGVVLQAGLVPAGTSDPVVIAKALQKLEQKLDVSPVAKTDLIAVRYEARSPEQARRVLDTLASLYLAKQRNVQGRDYQMAFFKEQVKEHGEALDAAENQLIDFTHRTGVVSADLERELTIRQMKAVSGTKMETAAEIAEARGRAAQLAAQLTAQPGRVNTESRSADNPQLLEQLKVTLLNLQLKRDDLLNKYDEHYRLVQDVDREIATAQSILNAQVTAPVQEVSTNVNPIRQELESELTKTRAQLAGLSAKLSELSSSSSELELTAQQLSTREAEQDALLRDVKTEKDRYQLYVDKLEQARMAHALDQDGILNVVLAQAPIAPALPVNSTVVVLVSALFTGTLLSLGAAFLADVFDPTIRTATELGEVLPLPVLAEFGPVLYLEGRK
jgi:uncharacterized protein involved in exopolysaccharide biosynthesis